MPSATLPETLINPTEAWWARLAARDDRAAPALLAAEHLGGRHQRSVYELFSEMEEKDAHLHSAIQTRANGLLSLPRRVVAAAPGGEGERRAAAFAEEALQQVPRFEEFLRALLDGMAKGFAVVELLWDYDARGRLCVADWIAHPQEWFAFDAAGRVRLLAPPFRSEENATDREEIPHPAGRSLVPAASHLAPPPRKFIVLRFGADFRNPYGRGLCQRAYGYYWLKKNVLKFWSIHQEKFGSPTAVATCGTGTSEEERRRLAELLDALQTETSIVIPESVELKLLDPGRASGAGSYRDFLDWCNDEVSKLVLGATLTTGEGRRSGSLALGTIHQLVRQDYIDADAGLLCRVLNETLVRWIVELNLGSKATAPHLQIETESPTDMRQRIEVDRALLGIGVSLPQSYFYERYGRPAPGPLDTPLQFDDANFYQYHLQFGVLTVNEVRARLNLAPVPWGDARTAAPGPTPPPGRIAAEDRGSGVI